MLSRKTKLLGWFMVLVVVMACAPVFSAAPPLPTLDSGAINTYIAQTAESAATQTSVAIPTLSPTILPTSTMRYTKTPEPTATNTFIWIPASPTLAANNQNYACQLISVTPASGSNFGPRDDFDITWKVKNVGKKDWDNKNAEFIYVSGDKIHKVSAYPFKKKVDVGVAVSLTASMQAPKNPEIYITTWGISIGSNLFCKVSFTIVVK